MSELFIHYLWQYQYFNKASLLTTSGESIHIFSPGIRNRDAGPDFLQAKIRLADVQWVGSVEIHVDASGWYQHNHHDDATYENVILHVVWRNDRQVFRSDGSELPTLAIGGRVEERVIFSYRRLAGSVDSIPCSYALPYVKPIFRRAAVDRAATARLESKAMEVVHMLNRNRGDWDETCYQLLARNFGFKVNAEPFLQLAQTLPYRLILKHADRFSQAEAMLFGVAGFLDDVEDDPYYKLLQREFSVLRIKYRLEHRLMKKVQWKFLRLRPANFPTLRIAQFAACAAVPNLFSSILNSGLSQLYSFFWKEPSLYWQTHYNFRRATSSKVAQPGVASIQNILVNTIAPAYAAYALVQDDNTHMQRAVTLLHDLPSENNRIIKEWASHSVTSKNAFDSQGLIELYNGLCIRHRCLDCNIGASLIKPVKV